MTLKSIILEHNVSDPSLRENSLPAALSLGEAAIVSALESIPNIDCLKNEQKKCSAALLEKKNVLLCFA